MSNPRTRRTFLQHSLAAVAAFPAIARAEVNMAKQAHLCVTCGTQFAETDEPPANCPICDDERQYVGWEGQRWTTLPEMLGHFKNVIREEEPGLHSIHTEPRIGIVQRAFLVR